MLEVLYKMWEDLLVMSLGFEGNLYVCRWFDML